MPVYKYITVKYKEKADKHYAPPKKAKRWPPPNYSKQSGDVTFWLLTSMQVCTSATASDTIKLCEAKPGKVLHMLGWITWCTTEQTFRKVQKTYSASRPVTEFVTGQELESGLPYFDGIRDSPGMGNGLPYTYQGVVLMASEGSIELYI